MTAVDCSCDCCARPRPSARPFRPARAASTCDRPSCARTTRRWPPPSRRTAADRAGVRPTWVGPPSCPIQSPRTGQRFRSTGKVVMDNGKI